MPNGQPLAARIEGKELADKYREWAKDNIHLDVTQRSAETQVGNLMRAMGINKTRSTPQSPRMFELSEVKDMCKRFAGILGHTTEEVFTEI